MIRKFPFPTDERQRSSSTAGFSLVELMIVVGIIGVLAALAIPKFQKIQARARMAEAKNMLNHIFTLEESFHLSNNFYKSVPTSIGFAGTYDTAPVCANADARELGLEFSPCEKGSPRYSYQIKVDAGTKVEKFEATALTGDKANNLVCPGYEVHSWYMNEERKLKFNFATSHASAVTTAADGTVGTTPRCEK